MNNTAHCIVCRKPFTRIDTNSDTSTLVKSRDEINACETCGNSVSQKDHHAKHKHIQTGYNPDKHDICDNRGILFTRIGDFTNHIPSHTGDDPYICGICEKSFSEKDILAEHMIIHIGEKTNEDQSRLQQN